MTRVPKSSNLFSAFEHKRKAQGFSPMARPQQKTPGSGLQYSSLMKTKLSSVQEVEAPSQPSSPLPHSTIDSAPETRPSSPLLSSPAAIQSESKLPLAMQVVQRPQTGRTAWPAEADYSFIKTLARHTTCDGTNGLALNHIHMDQAAIQLVEDSLSHNVDIKLISRECGHRFPNKNEAHYSVQSIELLIELSKNCPGYSFQQLNQKHMNMWTRAIVPFRHVFETGTLHKSKQLFHRDCKKFAKVFINFFVFVVQNGTEADYCPTLVKSAGQASKLLEQWVLSMFEHHGTNMSHFMFQCGLRLCRAYIRNKQTVYPTVSEHAILTSPSPSASDILVVLKNYFGYICEYEDVTPAAKFEMDSRNMQTNKPFISKAPVDPTYAQQTAPVAHPRMEHYSRQSAYTRPTAFPPPQSPVAHSYSFVYPPQGTHSRPSAAYPHPISPRQGDLSRPAPQHTTLTRHSSVLSTRPTPAYTTRPPWKQTGPAYNDRHYSPTHNIHLDAEQGEQDAYVRLHSKSRTHIRQPSDHGNLPRRPAYSHPDEQQPPVGRAAGSKYTFVYPPTLSPMASVMRANESNDSHVQPVRLAPILEKRQVKVCQDADSNSSELSEETSAESSLVFPDKQSSLRRLLN